MPSSNKVRKVTSENYPTDAGREGEAIFRRVYGLVGSKLPVKRLWISSMEDSAIQQGFDSLKDGAEYDNLFAASECRAKADWLIGMNGTRAFTKKYGRRQTIGRVQTPTLAMLTERQNKIQNFVKEPYYKVEITGNGIVAESERMAQEQDADTMQAACDGQCAVVGSIERKRKEQSAPKLYDLTTLQREANRYYGFTASQTLKIVQELYEEKLVTYPRTDSQYITEDMQQTMADLLKHYGGEADGVKQVVNNKKVTDHHSRKTKLGRVEWNPGTLAGVLANERHCGDVLARKTFTPNFLTHKSKKNNNDRTQYRQKNHHEAIVSREVFNAANHLRASRNYSKKNRPLPVLSVVEDGILRGYVPFDKDWTGFSAEEYREASESVMKEPDVTVTADVKKRLDLTGYEIVRVQYFSTMQNPAMTISNGRLRFNTACLKKFENVEYVELLLNSVERCIAIRPCDKNNPNAIRWGRLKEGRWCASTLGCRGLAKTLFDIMEWDEDLRYRFRGQFLEQGDNKMMLFAFDEPEMIKVEEIVLPPKENTEEDEGETVKKKIYIFPPEWAGTFGQPITSIAQVGILRQEHYAGNWDVFRPATEIEEMNIFTAESLNELLREAEKIMEGWTDYR